jgi:RHS repeat-associated protein
MIQWDNTDGSWMLRLKDGTVFHFPENDGGSARTGAVISASDRFGNTLTFTRDWDGNLTHAVSSSGRSIDFVYDENDRITQASDNLGRTATYQYDSNGHLIKAIDPAGQFETYTYDGNDQMLTVHDKRGNLMVTNIYDSHGRVAQQTYADATTNLFAYTLDANNKVTQTDVTDERGNVTRMVFNSSGYPTTIIKAVGKPEQQSVTKTRDPTSSRILSQTDALGRKTVYTYDKNGNELTRTELADTANAVTTTKTYTSAFPSAFQQIASVTDPLNHTTSFDYDASGNLTKMTDPLGHQITVTYNSAGQPLTITDPLNHTTTLTYDGTDLAAISDPLGGITRYFVDGAGRVLTLTDPMGNVTRYAYDPLNRMTSMTDALEGVTAFAFDSNGNLTRHTDAKGGIYSYTYDARNRRLTRTDPLLHTESYAYDQGGNLTRFTDRKGQVSGYSYDALNRRVSAGFGATTSQPTTYTSGISYGYDAGNRLTQVVDSAAGTITRSYDGLDRLTNETTPQGSVGYTYDSAGRRSSMSVAGQATVNYTYDNADRLVGIAQGSTGVSFSYDNANRRSTLTLANGIVVSYTYDTANRLTGIVYTHGSTQLGNLSYGYDANGRRISVGGSYANADLPTAIASAAYNAANQLTQWGSTNISYDLNGNLSFDGSTFHSWNARDQLNGLSQSGFIIGYFEYDGVGRRIGKTGTGPTTAFLYDGSNPVQELADNTPTANLLTGGLDEVFSRTDSVGARHLLTDALGSTLALTDSNGVATTSYSYEPYGKASTSGAANDNSYQYTGRENDSTGLNFNRARYYSPSLHRFISEDPIGLAGGLNMYAYVEGNPINYTDPSGEILVNVATGAIGGLAGAVGNYFNQKYIQGNCKIDWDQVINAGAWGAVAGALLPFTGGISGATALGGAAGGLQYVTGQLISGSPMTLSGGAIGVATGAGGAGFAGAFTRTVGYGAVGTALPELATQQQTYQSLAANAGISNVLRNLLGGLVGNYDPNATNHQGCTCKK